MIKKQFFGLILMGCVFSQSMAFAESSATMDLSEAKFEKLTDEVRRNKELLEIWKEHVRDLTQERDEALKRIESMKTSQGSLPMMASSGSVAKFGEVETQPLSHSPMGSKVAVLPTTPDTRQMQRDIEGYQQSVREVRENMKKLELESKKIQKEYSEATNDRNLVIKEKAAAIGKIDQLNSQIKTLQEENARLVSMAQVSSEENHKIKEVQESKDAVIRENESLRSQVEVLGEDKNRLEVSLKEMQAQSFSDKEQISKVTMFSQSLDALKVENADLSRRLKKMKQEMADTASEESRIEELLQSATAQLSVQTSEKDDLISKINALQSELISTKTYAKELEGYKEKLAEYELAQEQLRQNNIKLSQHLQSHKKWIEKSQALLLERDALTEKNVSYENKQRELEMQSQTLRSEIGTLTLQNESVKKSLTDYENRMQEILNQNQKMENEFAQQQAANGLLVAEREGQLKKIQSLESNLKQNYDDMKNLEMNMKSYLDSLVSSFSERQKN